MSWLNVHDILLFVGFLALASARRGYILTAPKVLQAGSEESVCVTFHDIDFDVRLTLKLTESVGRSGRRWGPPPPPPGRNQENQQQPEIYSQSDQLFRKGLGGCVLVRVPSNLTVSDAKLVVSGGSADSTKAYRIEEESKKVTIKGTRLLTFIQTDKPIYKPGQTVRIRMLAVKPCLRPRLGKLSMVWIEDPNGVRMQQWKDVEATQGLASLEMPMSEEPVLGDWKIKVEFDGMQEVQTFTVQEYVLPKFEVLIKPPPYVRVDDREIRGEICAKYTYGQPVKGHLKAEVCMTSRSHYYRPGILKRPCVNITTEIHGCIPLIVETGGMNLSSTQYHIWGSKLKIFAEVEETATGIVLNATHDTVPLVRDVFTINFKPHSPDYFKPGMPYKGKLVATRRDNTPAAGELINLELTNYQYNRHFSKNYTTDDKGEVSFGLPVMESAVASFSIQARAPAYATTYQPHYYMPYEPTAYHSVKQWYSPSGSFLDIQRTEGAAACGGEQEINIMYTTEAESNITFYYQIMARGNIVRTGQQSNHYLHEGSEESVEEDIINIDLVFNEDAESQPPIAVLPAQVRAPPGGRRNQNSRQPVQEEIIRPGYHTSGGPHIELPEVDETVFVPPLPYIATFQISIPVLPKMAPRATMLVYYVRDDGETVAGETELSIERCFENKVSLTFKEPEKYPGDKATITLRADPGSLCAVGSVDKSVHLLGGPNQLTMDKVFSLLEQYQLNEHSGPWEYDDYCLRKQQEEDSTSPPGGLPSPPSSRPRARGAKGARPARSVWGGGSYSQYYDAIRAFKKLGMLVLTDLELETRPCSRASDMYYGREVAYDLGGPMLGAPGPAGGSAIAQAVPDSAPGQGAPNSSPAFKPVVEIRNYFPETWLWNLELVGSDGEKRIRKEIPHTITDWMTSGFCTNTGSGMGVAPIVTLRAFQPFFASFTLPYSVIRGEEVTFPVTVFNYLSSCLVVSLRLKKARDDTSFDVVGSRSTEICVCGGDSVSHHYTIIPKQLDKINITVRADSVARDGVCGNGLVMSDDSSTIGVRDIVVRQLLVEAEGKEETYSYSSFVCHEAVRSDVVTDVARLELPHDLVPDSGRAYVTIIGDVMGSSLSGLDQLLRLPTGCGEQNMLKFSPNIFVLQYLTNSGQLTESIKSKAVSFLKTGYQRELTYRHVDGSYSAFGKSDSSGSMWLTAFVVKSFAQARPFIFIDEVDLTRSIGWFKSKQLENGCFPQVGTVHHKSMKGGLADGGSSAALTAYVLIAMLEAGSSRNDPAVTDAVFCLRSQPLMDVYTVALVAYAYTVWEKTSSERQEMMARLESMATHKDGLMYWSRPDSPAPTRQSDGWWVRPYYQAPSADVEMTAYALMAYTAGGGTNMLGQTLPIVKWLSKQRNEHGGFASTQDTVLALQALSQYAELTFADGLDMVVEMSGQEADHTFNVNDNNKLVLQEMKVPVPNTLTFNTVSIRQSGCVFIQANVKYNKFNLSDEAPPAFQLSATVHRVNGGQEPCKERSINVCTKYIGPDGESNMAVVAVKMISGWIPIKDSIKELAKDRELELKKFEVDKNQVHFYFQQLTAEYKCFSFQVEQFMEVKHTKPGNVQVYDYYETDLSMMTSYNIRPTCGTKEELPDVSPEEYEELNNPVNEREIVQVRQPVRQPLLGESRGGRNRRPRPPKSSRRRAPVADAEV